MGSSTRISGKDACEALADFVNDYGADAKGFIEELRRSHRTIQQNFGRLMVCMLRQWALDFERNNYDARNEATCRLAAKTVASWKDCDDFLPYI